MNVDEWSLSYRFLHQMLPAMLCTSVACGAWLWFCRWYYRADERAWREALRTPPGYEAASHDDRMRVLIAQRSIVGRGSSADRLFIAGLAVSALVGLVALAAVLAAK